jgi:GTP-binding protein HflX
VAKYPTPHQEKITRHNHISKEKNITKNIIVTRAAQEKALLLAVSQKGSRERQIAENSLEELALLAESAGAKVVEKIVQQLPAPSHDYYIGKGKIQELLALKSTKDYTILILDDELTPKQQQNLEKELDVKVIDRVALILDIFARRARTHEGRLQVELAQHQYLLPRLAGQWSHLERLGGGIGTRGPGESQLETDRRLIRRKIQRLEEQTEEISKRRALYRQQRQQSRVPVVALVGYTNAGKSTLLNALCRADALVDDRLFATLDPTTHRLKLPNNNTILVTDTVGFIRKLPPTIISAFRATLEELSEASLLLHVVDLSSPDAPEQCQAVEKILGELGLLDKKRITVLNKIDCLLPSEPTPGGEGVENVLASLSLAPDESTVIISAVKGWGLPRLLEMIIKAVSGSTAPAPVE